MKDNSSGSFVSNATIKVYGSSADRQNKANSLLTTSTNINGVLTIAGVTKGKTYYLYATDGTKSAYASKSCVSGANNITMKLTSGNLKFVNNNEDPYIFTATNSTTGTVYTCTVGAGYTKTLSDCEIGYYNVSYEQKSGYILYPTTGDFNSMTLNDGYTLTFTKN